MKIFEAVKNNPELVSAFFDASGAMIAAVTDENYIILGCNDNLTRSLHAPEKPLGRYLGDILCPLEEDAFPPLVSEKSGELLPQMLKLCHTEIMFKCYNFSVDGVFLVLGDRMGGTDNEVMETMSLLNNELSGLTRELGKKNRELETAYRKITELSRTDPLTGLANRRYFKERYEEEFALSQRHEFPLSLAMMDLDHFKQVNDTLGHNAGDEVLKVFAWVLGQNCRLEDFPARFGGEEFIIFLPHTAADKALVFGNRIRETLSGMDILENPQWKVTISVGIAQQKIEDTPEGLIKRADEALYAAKRQGRNRCEVK
ncbi:MAG: GGDEF domain-containing protein [Desulfobacteraceae bacterium]|nr:GGDEF domain-containing protein [Desulfobacteraceae bacterium]